ncbi:MAG: hypothetical protein DRO88_05800 [Promethearchaeia archaeon]|nr:MAG: hypothetical protein DRO88_05800 [Candidatus Lokiarchaeia archaeon]
MPYGDRTGPNGLGPRTGRGLGYCNGYPYPGYANPVGGPPLFLGRGRGGGWGRGGGRRGFGRGALYWGAVPGVSYPYAAPALNPEDQKKTYEAYVNNLETELENAKKYLAELNKASE